MKTLTLTQPWAMDWRMTPNEKKQLDRLRAERDAAEQAREVARRAVSDAHKAFAIARREYVRALQALTKENR